MVAISPVPPSNVNLLIIQENGIPLSGMLIFLMMEVCFSWAKDNKAKLYIENQLISELDHFKGVTTPLKSLLKR